MSKGAEWGRCILRKGVSVRFGFDDVRTSQTRTVSQRQSNEERPAGCIYTYIHI